MRGRNGQMLALMMGAALMGSGCGKKQRVSPAEQNGFAVYTSAPLGGGWVIHHDVNHGDTLWGCHPTDSESPCLQVFFDEWRPATRMDFLHVSVDSDAGWLRLRVPGDGDWLYACYSPLNKPRCERISMELRPAQSALERAWPFVRSQLTDGTPLAEDDPRRVLGVAQAGQLLVELGPSRSGPSNLYACRGLEEESPVCALSSPNWLAYDRAPLGFRKLENVEVREEDGTFKILPGARVVLMVDDSLALKSGLVVDDVITRIGPFDVKSASHARYLFAQYPAGSEIEVTLQDGRVLTLERTRRSQSRGLDDG